MKVRILTPFVAIFAWVTSAGAASLTAGGYVKSVDVRESGAVMVTLQSPHNDPQGCGKSDSVAIARNHRAKKEMLAVVLSAQATGAKVEFGINGCSTDGAFTSAEAVSAAVVSE